MDGTGSAYILVGSDSYNLPVVLDTNRITPIPHGTDFTSLTHILYYPLQNGRHGPANDGHGELRGSDFFSPSNIMAQIRSKKEDRDASMRASTSNTMKVCDRD